MNPVKVDSPAKVPELDMLTRFTSKTLSQSVPDIYDSINDRAILKTIFFKHVFTTPLNANLVKTLKDLNVEISKQTEQQFLLLHTLFNDPDSSRISNITNDKNKLEQFQLLMLAIFKATKSNCKKAKIPEPKVPEEEKKPKAPAEDLSRFDPPAKMSDQELAMKLQLEEFNGGFPQARAKGGAQAARPVNLLPQREFTFAEEQQYNEVLNAHRFQLLEKLSNIDFIAFLSLFPRFQSPQYKESVRQLNNGQTSLAIEQLFACISTQENGWKDFFAAMNGIDELAGERALFMNPLAAIPKPQKEITNAEKERHKQVLNKNLSDIQKKLASIDFIKFLACMPSVSKRSEAINMRAQWNCGQRLMSVRTLFDSCYYYYAMDWSEFLNALEKFEELKNERALFA